MSSILDYSCLWCRVRRERKGTDTEEDLVTIRKNELVDKENFTDNESLNNVRKGKRETFICFCLMLIPKSRKSVISTEENFHCRA